MFSRYFALTAMAAALLGLGLGPAQAQIVTGANCSVAPNGHVEWPAGNPIWTFDFVRPTLSSGTDGSGVEIRNVYYNGRLVFKRAHAPIINVEYDPGAGCSCFRDWSDSEAGFAYTGTAVAPCVAVANAGSVRTTCDSNQDGGSGGDTGSFRGVAIEEFPGELVVTTHMTAGWYRYRMKWHFYDDGRIWPEYSFAAASATCTSAAHRHHTYWRFDFDIDGTPNNDVIREVNPTAGSTTAFTTETTRTWGNGTDGIYWTVTDTDTGAGYTVEPSAADLALPVDAFSKLDAMVLRYKPTEVDDRSVGSTGCAISPNLLANNESVDGQDVVLYYRSSALHAAGNPWECDIVGPTLNPFGGIPVELTRFDYVLEGRDAVLSWATASETNNSGFEVQHKMQGDASWETLSFVPGHGTTEQAHTYSYRAAGLRTGIHVFRLRQVDFDGQSEFSREVEVAVDVPGAFVLEAAYPNPFNPTTTLRFKVAQRQQVRIELVDALGRVVRDLYNGMPEANRYETVRVDGSNLASGTYTVRLVGENALVGTTRIVLVK